MRIRKDGTILLNALQMATYQELLAKSVDGVVSREITDGYKQNVIRSLSTEWPHGDGYVQVMKGFNKHFRFVKGNTIIEQPEVQPRTPKVDVAFTSAVVEQGQQAEAA